MIWSIIGVVTLALIARHFWRSYSHPYAVLGRQAANMNWIAKGSVNDTQGFKNLRLVRDGMEVQLTFSPVQVRLIRPFNAEPFSDFLALERWLGSKEFPQSINVAHGSSLESDEEPFFERIEKQLDSIGRKEQLLALQASDPEYLTSVYGAWQAAENASETPHAVAAFTVTSIVYYDKNRDVALSYLQRLKSGWTGLAANPGLHITYPMDQTKQPDDDSEMSPFQIAMEMVHKRGMLALREIDAFSGNTEAKNSVLLHSWFLVYLSAYKGKKSSNTDIHPSLWSTFKRRIEIELLAIKDDGSPRSGVVETPDGGRAFAHFSSGYVKTMDFLENALDDIGVRGMAILFLQQIGSPQKVEVRFIEAFEELCLTAKEHLVPAIARLAS